MFTDRASHLSISFMLLSVVGLFLEFFLLMSLVLVWAALLLLFSHGRALMLGIPVVAVASVRVRCARRGGGVVRSLSRLVEDAANL